MDSESRRLRFSCGRPRIRIQSVFEARIVILINICLRFSLHGSRSLGQPKHRENTRYGRYECHQQRNQFRPGKSALSCFQHFYSLKRSCLLLHYEMKSSRIIYLSTIRTRSSGMCEYEFSFPRISKSSSCFNMCSVVVNMKTVREFNI